MKTILRAYCFSLMLAVSGALIGCQNGGGSESPTPQTPAIPSVSFNFIQHITEGFPFKRISPLGDTYLFDDHDGTQSIKIEEIPLFPPLTHPHVFVSKMNPDGESVWTTSFEVSMNTSYNSIPTLYLFGPNGDPYLSARFESDQIILPGTSADITLVKPAGFIDAYFVAKIDPTNGKVIWAKLAPYDNREFLLRYSDQDQALYLISSKASEISFEQVELSTGQPIWSQQVSSTGNVFPNLILNSAGKPYLSINFHGANLDLKVLNNGQAQTTTFTNSAFANNGPNALFGRLDPQTGAFIEVYQAVSADPVLLTNLSFEKESDRFYLWGTLNGTASLEWNSSSIATFENNSTNPTRSFFIKIDPAQQNPFVWFLPLDSDNTVTVYEAVQNSTHLCLQGIFTGTSLKIGEGFQTPVTLDNTTGNFVDYTFCLDPSSGNPFQNFVWDQPVRVTRDPSSGKLYSSMTLKKETAVFNEKGTFHSFQNTGPMGFRDKLIAKLGDTNFDWVFQIGGPFDDDFDLIATPAGKLYFSGSFENNNELALPGLTTPLQNESLGKDAFLGELNPQTGQILWVQNLDAQADEETMLLEAVGEDLFVSGSFRGKLRAEVAGSPQTWISSVPNSLTLFIGKIQLP